MKFKAQDCIEHKLVGKEFKRVNTRLWRFYDHKDYKNAAATASKLLTLLPKKIPTNYPFSEDYREEWLCEIGELRMMANDYAGTEKTYYKVRYAPPANQSRMLNDGSSRQIAAFSLATLYALKGNRASSIKQLDEAPTLYFSGCGNCSESTSQYQHRLKAVYNAATSGKGQIESQLLNLARGEYQPLPARLDLGSEKIQISRVKAEATFVLAEWYLRAGKKDMAKHAFSAVSDGYSLTAKMAQNRLRTLNR